MFSLAFYRKTGRKDGREKRSMEERKKIKRKEAFWSSHCGSAVTDPTRILEDVGSIPGVAQWVKDPVLL